MLSALSVPALVRLNSPLQTPTQNYTVRSTEHHSHAYFFWQVELKMAPESSTETGKDPTPTTEAEGTNDVSDEL
jgi:hypothetical protein